MPRLWCASARVRPEKNRLLEVRDGLLEANRALAGGAKMNKRLNGVGFDLERLLKARDRFVETFCVRKITPRLACASA